MTAERTPPADQPFLTQSFAWLAERLLRAPLTPAIAAAAIACICLGIAANGLQYETSSLDLLNRRSEFNRRWLNYVAEFGEQDDIVVVARANTEAEFGPAIDTFAAELRAKPQAFELILHHWDLTSLNAKGLHFSSPADLARIAEFMQQAQRLAERGPAAADPVANLRDWNARLPNTGRIPPENAGDVLRDYTELAAGLTSAVQTGGMSAYPLPPLPSLPAEQSQATYLLTPDQRAGMIYLRLVPDRKGSAANSLAALRIVTANMQRKFPHVTFELTGQPLLAAAERTSSWTIIGGGLFSVTAVSLLFFAIFGGWRQALLTAVVLLLAGTWTLGFSTLIVGRLHLLSAAAGMVGFAVVFEFVVHFLARVGEQRKQGTDVTLAISQALQDAGPGMTTVAAALAMSFFVTGFSDFVGLAEFGIIAAGSTLMCFVATIFVLPPLTLLLEQHLPLSEPVEPLPIRDSLRFFHQLPLGTTVLGAILAILLTAGVTRLRYDFQLPIAADISTFALSICDSRDELESKRERLSQLPTVAKIEEIVSLTPEHDPLRARTIARIQESLLAIHRLPPPGEISAEALQQELEITGQLLAKQGWERTTAYAAVQRLQQQLTTFTGPEAALRLHRFRDQLRTDLRQQLRPLQNICDPLSPTLNDLPRELTARFVGRTQRHLIKIYPRHDLRQMSHLEQFVAETEGIDPLLTGHPVRACYAARLWQRSFLVAGLLALAVVGCVVYLDLQSLSGTALALAPLLISGSALLGLLGWWRIPLTPTNLVALPPLLALGLHHGVQLVHELRRQSGRFQLPASLGVSLLLPAVVMMGVLGIGMFTWQPSWQPLGRVFALGVFLTTTTSLFFFPAALRWLTAHKETEAAEEVTPASEPLVQPRRRIAA